MIEIKIKNKIMYKLSAIFFFIIYFQLQWEGKFEP